MKIKYFRLKGYIKVLNGMGLEELVIPFNQFKNRIVLVQGENGCSKSTIISALSPNPDTSDSFRTDVFIDEFGTRQIIEYPAEKEIHYVGTDEDGSENYYKILIQSLVDESRTRRTTKAFISKNGEELNPNGNVASFKEIRDSVLGIDPIYLDLSSISAENRGIVDMIPSERRKYMASYIGSLDTYNNIFKVISKKATTLKSYMNTLSSKIYELGDESEMRLKLMQLETSLKDLNKSRDTLLGNLAEAEATVKIIDPDGKMQDLYTSISERLGTVNIEITQNQDNLDRESMRFKIDAQNTDLLDLQSKTSSSISEYEKNLESDKSKLGTLMSLNEATMNGLESDRMILSGLSSSAVQDNIEAAVEKVRSEVKMYEDYLSQKDIRVLDKISFDELVDLRESIVHFDEEIRSLQEFAGYTSVYSNALISSMEDGIVETLNATIKSLQSDSGSYAEKLINLKRDLQTAVEDLEALESFDNTRPKECKIDTCPYIAKYMNLKKSGTSKKMITDIEKEIERYTAKKEEADRSVDIDLHMMEVIRRIEVIFSGFYSKRSVIAKIPELKPILDMNDLKRMLADGRYKKPAILDIVNEYIEKSSTYEDLKKAKEQLRDLESDLVIYQNNKALVDSLTEKINKAEKEYAERLEEIEKTNNSCGFVSDLIYELKAKLTSINAMIEYKNRLEASLKEKENLRNEFEAVKDKIKLVKEKMDSVNDIKNRIATTEESIEPLAESINQVKYNLTNIVSYQQEFKECSDKYEKTVFIRNACSPGNGMGIQSEYIKRYMNDIIIDCNQMLGYMFNGTIQLDVPVINEKQFSIPFLGPNGIMVPDISNGSTAQKCMIGLVFSCVAMMKSSLKYNIPRFDEIDGGLDQQNRVMFINVLNQILDFMQSEQCIICSHNMEFDTQSTTRLLCSHSGIRIEQ